MRALFLFLAALVAMAPHPAAAEPGKAADAAALAVAGERGALLYAYDRAAWHGSDDLRVKLPDFEKKVGGWIVDGPIAAPRLVFFDRDEASPRIVYTADFEGTTLKSSRVHGETDDRTLTPERKAMIAARRTALKAMFGRDRKLCSSQNYNSVVLPPARPGAPTLVYFMAPQTRNDALPMGGHYLVEVSPSGRAGKARAFTNSCIELSLAPPEPEGELVALGITDLIHKTPTEIHVFSSLAARLPIFVNTVKNNRSWIVAGRNIEPVKGGAGQPREAPPRRP